MEEKKRRGVGRMAGAGDSEVTVSNGMAKLRDTGKWKNKIDRRETAGGRCS
jgi:hypothetical protein